MRSYPAATVTRWATLFCITRSLCGSWSLTPPNTQLQQSSRLLMKPSFLTTTPMKDDDSIIEIRYKQCRNQHTEVRQTNDCFFFIPGFMSGTSSYRDLHRRRRGHGSDISFARQKCRCDWVPAWLSSPRYFIVDDISVIENENLFAERKLAI